MGLQQVWSRGKREGRVGLERGYEVKMGPSHPRWLGGLGKVPRLSLPPELHFAQNRIGFSMCW